MKRIWIRFTCVSLFHYKISLLFFRFFLLLFASNFSPSLHFGNFCFEVKQSEAKFKSIFSLLSLFSLFSLFFAFFRFFSLFSLFSLFLLFLLQIFRFASILWFLLRSETKRSEIQVFFLLFFTFFRFFSLFFAFFRLIFVSFQFFR